ncbi:MAG: RNA polymerase sigma factor [Bdellovibrionales bacterium]|nr:RNA polymerase sigma factor [Bdellovibrionales bacterium]
MAEPESGSPKSQDGKVESQDRARSLPAAPVARTVDRESAKRRDDELVKRTLGGDRSAFQELFEIYRPKVQSLAYEILKSQDDAEDVVQESFVKAYLALAKYRGQAAFYTWLFRIVYNMAIDYKRRIVRRGGDPVELNEESLNSSDFSSSYESSWGRSEDPYSQVERRQELALVQRALGRLSDEHRAVITLREVDGLSYDEIAEVIGVTKGTVMSRLHYARKALQSALGKKGPE